MYFPDRRCVRTLCILCVYATVMVIVQVAGSNLTVGHLQAALSKLLTDGVLRSTQPPTLRGTGNE